MKSDITPKTVAQMAKLARLSVSDEDVGVLTEHMQRILAYVEKLSELDVDDVMPTTHGVSLPARLRADQVGDCLATDDALDQAPEPIGKGFGVPKVIDG